MILLDAGAHPGLLHKILQGDYWLFSRINQDWTGSFGDTVLPFAREPECWIPFYLFSLVFVTLNFGKRGWLWSLYVGMTAIIADLLSEVIKYRLVYRLRPCNNEMWADTIHLPAGFCPATPGFTSSHACVTFAAAVFVSRTLRHLSSWWMLALAWAFIVSYSQVYIGIHYPLDVFTGGILGALIGWVTSRVFRLQAGALSLQPNTRAHA